MARGSSSARRPPPAAPSLTYQEAMRRGREQVARRYLRLVLAATGGNVTRAAKRAGIERESLYRLLRRHGIDPTRFRRA